MIERSPAPRAARLLAAALLPALACAPAPPPPAGASAAPSARASRAVLLSFDGVSGERLSKLLAEGRLPHGGFRRVADRGLFARRSTPPSPSLTAVSHVTHVTGALPEKTGIVANWMLDRSKPFGTKLSGFDAPIRAETLWQAARRQGKRVAILLYPGGDGRSPERRGDFGMAWVYDFGSDPRLETIGASRWGEAKESVPSFSPPRSLRLALLSTAHAFSVTALDTTDDGRTNYDRVRVQGEAGPPVEAREGEWFPVEVAGEPSRTGAWCKVLRLAPDLSETKIYVGALNSNRAYPEEFRRELDRRVGFWPGRPDDGSLGADTPWEQSFREQADRIADFLTRATILVLDRPDWDLLLAYQPEVDELSHEFFLTDPRQKDYSPERAARFEAYVDGAYALADRSLDRIERALSPGDALVVTSDHGMAPLRTVLYPNEILRAAGLLKLDSRGEIDPSSEAAAIAESGDANIYVNAATAPAGTLDRIEAIFRSFRVEGEDPWDRVLRRADAGPLGLDAPESGDLILLARPGFSFSTKVKPGRTSGRPDHYGGHGYRNDYAPLDATFLAAGPGIAHARLDGFPSWRIAGFLSRALGIEPPRQASP